MYYFCVVIVFSNSLLNLQKMYSDTHPGCPFEQKNRISENFHKKLFVLI
jgi:hypothetical protein